MFARRSISLALRLTRIGLLATLALLLAGPGQATVAKDGGFVLHIQLDEEDGFDFDRFERPTHRPMTWPMPSYDDDEKRDRDALAAKLREKLGRIGDEHETRLRTLFRRGLAHLRERRGERIEHVLRRIKEHIRRHHRDGGYGGYEPKPKPPVVPEPSTALLIGMGLAGLGQAGRRARR